MRTGFFLSLLGFGMFAFPALAQHRNIETLFRLDPKVMEALRANGMATTHDVARKLGGDDGRELTAKAKKWKVRPEALRDAVTACRLIGVPGIGPRTAFVLSTCYDSPEKFAQDRPESALRCLQTFNAKERVMDPLPPEDQVVSWQAEASKLGAKVLDASAVGEQHSVDALWHVGAHVLEALKKEKLLTTAAVVDKLGEAKAREAFARRHRLDWKEVEQAFGQADLMRIKGIDGRTAFVLSEAGYPTVVRLAAATREICQKKVADRNRLLGNIISDPGLEMVQSWIDAAKNLH